MSMTVDPRQERLADELSDPFRRDWTLKFQLALEARGVERGEAALLAAELEAAMHNEAYKPSNRATNAKWAAFQKYQAAGEEAEKKKEADEAERMVRDHN